MLPVKYRLTKDRDFKKINASGKAFFSSRLRIKFLANNQGFSRFAVVVSNKVSKQATKRNYLKRQIREIFRLNMPKIKINYDVICSAGARALGAKYQDLEKDLIFLLNKAKLLK
jgi:ribonuclease P protein component